MRSNCVALAVLAAVFAVSGCQKRSVASVIPAVVLPPPLPRPVPPPRVLPGPEPLPAIAPPPAPAAFPLEEANRAYSAGDYDHAARAYENYLLANPAGEYRDEALFHLGLTYVLRPAATDWKRASATFKQLADEYPNSPLRALTDLITTLRTELDQANLDVRQRDQKMKQLTTELDRLKRIDADRRRRP